MKEADKVIESLWRAAWKLNGVAGLFKADGDDGRILEKDESDGLYWLIKEIAEDIISNADLIATVKQSS